MTSQASLLFASPPILSYLQLPNDYHPSPLESPIDFIQLHIRQLPPHLLLTFSLITTPQQRTVIPTVRNRRLKYASASPPELSFIEARSQWPTLWEGRERRGVEEAQNERDWVRDMFLEGTKGHIGKLAELLGDYEEEREAERVRVLRRERAANEAFVPEEDSDSDDEDEPDVQEEIDPEDAKISFERLVKERFIYGLLDVSGCMFKMSRSDV